MMFQQEAFKIQIEKQESTIFEASEEIHNNIGQLLNTTKMLLGATGRNLKTIPDTLRTAEQVLSKAIQDLRLLGKSLNKSCFHHESLTELFTAEINRLNASGLAKAEYITTTKVSLNTHVGFILFRIIQEILRSRIEDESASEILITNSVNESHTIITITDNGNQLYSTNEDFMNHKNINRQLQLLKGKLHCRNTPLGKETQIAIPTEL